MTQNSLPIERLKGRENFDTWKFAVQAYLEDLDLWDCVSGVEQDKKKDTKCRSKLILLVDPVNYVHIQNTTTAKAAWDNLTKAFQDDGLSRRVGLLRILITTKLEDCSSVEEYVNRIVTTAHKLTNVGLQVTDEWVGTILLAGLPIRYEPMIMGIESSGNKVTADAIKTKLLQDVSPVQRDMTFAGTDSALYGSSSRGTVHKVYEKNRNTSSSDKNVKKGPRCYRCNVYGHISKNCTSTRVVSKNNVNSGKSNTSLFAAFSMQSGVSNEFFLDSGASCHLCVDVNMLLNARKGQALTITTANNETMVTDTVGDLKLPICISGEVSEANQNGKAERLNRSLLERARCLLIESGLPSSFWAEAVNTAAYLLNRSPCRSVELTPIQVWSGSGVNRSNDDVTDVTDMNIIPDTTTRPQRVRNLPAALNDYVTYFSGELSDPISREEALNMTWTGSPKEGQILIKEGRTGARYPAGTAQQRVLRAIKGPLSQSCEEQLSLSALSSDSMLKWTVHKTGGGCGGGGGGGRSPSQYGGGAGPCYSIRRAAARLSRHRPRGKENCDGDQENDYRPSPRKRDSIYMCLDSIPVALRDVSNYQSVPRTPENQAKSLGRASLGSQPRPRLKTPCSSCSPHRKELLRDRQTGVKRGRRQTPSHLVAGDPDRKCRAESFVCDSVSPVRKKQPCSNFRHQDLAAFSDQTPSTSERSTPDLPHIEYSPCPLRTTQSLVALRQRMTDTFPLISQGISLDNPLYYALKQSPTPSPVDLVNKEIPTFKKDASETPVHTREFMSNFIKNLNLGSNESDEIKLRPRQSILPCDKFQSCWLSKEKAKTCEVSPLARKLAWLRLNNVDKSASGKSPKCDDLLSKENTVNFSMSDSIFENYNFSQGRSVSCNLKTFVHEHEDCEKRKDILNQRVGDIVVGSSVINILNTNHDRKKCENVLANSSERPESEVTNLDISRNSIIKNCVNRSNEERELNAVLKRRGVIFNERTFVLNTPPTSDSDEKRTKTSSGCTSIDLDEPSTLKRQKVIRRRRLRSISDDNLPLCKRVANRHPISFLTLPKGLPSPFDTKSNQGIEETPKTTRSKSTSQLQLTSPKKVTFGSLYDIEYSDNGDPSLLGLTLPKGIPSPPSPSEEEIPGVRPLDLDMAKAGNKRKNDVTTTASDCSEETWDSHRHYLKTPKLSENLLNDGDVSFAESSRTKSPASSKANDEDDNDDDFSSLASSIVTDSPLRQSRSRRCLSFASPNKLTRSRKRIFGRGELEVSLKCLDNVLTIHVIRGRNLGRPGAEPCNAYVKVCLIPGNTDHQFHRTCVRRYSNNPRFDHRFLLQLCDNDADRRVLVSAWHRDRARRRSEFLGCMSFAVKNVTKKEISGTFRLLSQQCGRTQNVATTSTAADHPDVMANQSESSVEECVSIEESDVAPTPDPAQEKRTSISKKDVDKTSNEDSIFLKHLELDPPVENGQSKGQLQGSKGGRTPFTTTKRLSRQPGTSFGFSIAWTHPPRIERVEAGLPADQAGLRPGDYVIFVDKTNVVTLPEEEILKLIKSCGNTLTLEVYRKVSANGTIARSSLVSTVGLPVAPRQYTSTTCSAATGATTTTASVPADITKRRLHLPQVTFTSEGSPESSSEGRRQAVYQLLHLEQQYTLCLQFGIARFLLPLSERRDIITPQDHSVLFQNAQELLRLTEDLLEMMIQEEGEHFGMSVGRIYLRKMTAMMSGYRRYCCGLKKADCLLVEKTRNSAFTKLITEPPVPRRRPDLTTFVHKPLEHFRDILKLLQTIQNTTSSKDEDYPAISRVVHEFQAAYRDITVESGLMEPEVEGRPLLSLQDLESRLVFTRCKPFVLSSPGRQWIFGGDLSRVEGRSVRPFWALLFTDLLLFAKVSRDRVLFVTEEPLSLQFVSQALFSIRKKATEFRLILSANPPGTDSPATGGCGGHLPDLPLTRTPRKGRGRRTIALRAPSPELKAVWQNLIQRQIIYLNTARGGTPASSPLDSPDPLTADSVATLDSLCLKRQVSEGQKRTGLDQLIEHRCRQMGKSGSNKGSALHLAQWMKGQLGSGSTAGPATPDTEPEPEVWSPATLRRRKDQLDGRGGLNRFGPRNESRCEDLDVSDYERSTSRCTEHSTDPEDSQNTVKSTSANSEHPLTVCRQCHKTCLVSNNNQDSTNRKDVNANRSCVNFTSLDDAGWTPLTNSPTLSPTDPFNPVPHISVLPPSPPTSQPISPANNNFWEDAGLSSAVDNGITPKVMSRGGSTEEAEDDSEGDGEGEGEGDEPPYRSLSPCGLRRYGTVSSLERLDADDSDGDETGKEQEDLPADGVVGGQLESVSQSLRGWTIRAGYFVAEKMALFERLGEDSRATSFFDRYLRSLPDQDVFSHELAATSTALAGEDECETSGGTSGEDIWGTPTSGDSELTSPTLEQCPDCPGLGTAADDAREALMMDELLGSVTLIPLMSSVVRREGFPQRRRLEPLPEDEEDTTESSSSPDVSECTKSYSTDQGNRSDSCVTRVRASTSPSSPGFFTRLRLRRSHSAESRTNKGSKILQFLRSTKSEDNTPSTSSGSRLMRLFSKDSTDDIPTTIPAPLVPPKQNEKTLERRFWKQIRRRRTTHSESLSPKSASLPAS
ncbi:uncharacterized protein LOC128991751 [Macrosteles quadrilineatus]|uniref:uncharacterized protein LOC128991751 n=1 Tax=Macrosteles quadrilineatus TaxID=74068 RepID=UPI0023E24B00|nr:uncharacterized protein LOC128991751 [Macrosteles quadrilineatus]